MGKTNQQEASVKTGKLNTKNYNEPDGVNRRQTEEPSLVSAIKSSLQELSKIIRKVKYDSPIHLFNTEFGNVIQKGKPVLIDPRNFIFTMIDYSLKSEAKKDEIFLTNQQLRGSLPTGLTLLKIQDAFFKNKGTVIGRYGLP